MSPDTGDYVTITVLASDADGDSLIYNWDRTGGTLFGIGASVLWVAPSEIGTYTISVSVIDGMGGSAATSKALVVTSDNSLPVIDSLEANPGSIRMGEITTLTVSASDPDGDILTYSWGTGEADFYGTFSGSGSSVKWTAPVGAPCCVPGPYLIAVTVDDGMGGIASRNITVEVTQ